MNLCRMNNLDHTRSCIHMRQKTGISFSVPCSVAIDAASATSPVTSATLQSALQNHRERDRTKQWGVHRPDWPCLAARYKPPAPCIPQYHHSRDRITAHSTACRARDTTNTTLCLMSSSHVASCFIEYISCTGQESAGGRPHAAAVCPCAAASTYAARRGTVHGHDCYLPLLHGRPALFL